MTYNNTQLIEKMPRARAKQELVMSALGEAIDRTATDDEIIEQVLRKAGFKLYAEKERQVKKGTYGKSFLTRLIWKIKQWVFTRKELKEN